MSEPERSKWSTVVLPSSQTPRFAGTSCYCCANGSAVARVRAKVLRVGAAKVLPSIGSRVEVPACAECCSSVRFRRVLPWVLLGVAVFCLALGAGRARFGFGSEPFLSADRFWGRAALVVLGAGCLLWVATAQGVSIDVVFDGVNVRYSFRERVVAEQFAAANRSSVEDGRQPPPSSPQHDPDELEDHGEAAIGISGDED